MTHKRIAIIFDFDETLAPDSTSSFLESLGLAAPEFWSRVNPLYQDKGWDPIPAYLYMMIKESQRRPAADRITQQRLREHGRQVTFYNGAQSIFRQLQERAHQIDPEVSVEFFLISSGIREILIHTKIAKYFKDIWACDFHYNQRGEIEFPKNIVSFTDKTRYLFHISKGIIGPDFFGKPFEVNRKISRDKMYVPFNQMIVVGDGQTDVPLFSVVEKYGGVAIAVYDRNDTRKWAKAWQFVEDERVKNCVPADYGKKEALNNSLVMAVESLASRLMLDETTYHR